MPWAVIIPLVIEMIRGCLNKDGEASVVARLNDPGLLERFALRRVLLRETNLRGRALREAINEGMEELRNGAADELIASAKEV